MLQYLLSYQIGYANFQSPSMDHTRPQPLCLQLSVTKLIFCLHILAIWVTPSMVSREQRERESNCTVHPYSVQGVKK